VPRYFGVLTILLLPSMVLLRLAALRRNGVDAMHFAKIDKKDFLILPFVLFYFYLVIGGAAALPLPSRRQFFRSVAIEWIGVAFCTAGLALLLLSMLSFSKSFRVGIDADHPDQLVTTGVFRLTRNPIYVAFGLVLLGQFLLFSNWIMLLYLFAATWLFHRQVVREESFLRAYYGQEYLEYCKRVRRYI
jgi:protein-S-isoprenylcysteine O-methyltransferase Ste14